MNKIIKFLFQNYLRLLIVVFWLGGLIGFLMIPYITRTFVEDRSLCVYMWSDKIDESVLYQFEKDTGIKIYINYYDSNEELITKLEIAKNPDCDIILPSGYIIQPLVEAGLLKKIDKSRCDFIDRIYPEFMGLFFDKNNDYSLPMFWDAIGIGYTHSYFPHGLPSDSWSMVFDQEDVPCKKISMLDDAREAIFLTSKYLDWTAEKFSKEQLNTLKKLFINQKKWVGSYTDSQQGYYLTSQTYPLAVSQREYVARDKLENDDIGFMIPKEGTLLTVDNLVICSASQKDDLVYKLINYIYRHDILLFNSEEFCILPVVKDVLDAMASECIGIEGIKPGQELFSRLEMFPNVLTQKQINDLWIAFKAS